MAYGMYDFAVRQDADALWRATLPVLDYVTVHNPRDAGAWPRKGKDNAEYRDGWGDGSRPSMPLRAIVTTLYSRTCRSFRSSLAS